MPIYEYSCNACGNDFEALIRGQKTASCPSCKSEDLKRLISLPRVKSDSTTDLAMRAAKKRDAAQATERMYTQLQYEQSHDRHG